MRLTSQRKAEKLELELQILVVQSMFSPVLINAAREESLCGAGKPSRIKGLKLV